jgi:hypothetical protein
MNTYEKLKEEANDSESAHKRMKAIEEFGNQFSNFANKWGSESNILAEYLSTQIHRTLQQGIMRFCMAYIRIQAKKPENWYDDRNEGTVLLSKFIVQKLEEAEAQGKYYGLPFI